MLRVVLFHQLCVTEELSKQTRDLMVIAAMCAPDKDVEQGTS